MKAARVQQQQPEPLVGGEGTKEARGRCLHHLSGSDPRSSPGHRRADEGGNQHAIRGHHLVIGELMREAISTPSEVITWSSERQIITRTGGGSA